MIREQIIYNNKYYILITNLNKIQKMRKMILITCLLYLGLIKC